MRGARFTILAVASGILMLAGASQAYAASLDKIARAALHNADQRRGLPPGFAVPNWVRKERNKNVYLMPPGRSKGEPAAGGEGQGSLGLPPTALGPIGPHGEKVGPDGPTSGNELGFRCTGTYCPQPPLRYLGGSVQHEPNVHLVFWGSNWNKEPGTVAKTDITNLLAGLSNSEYQEILTQYFDSTGRVSASVKYNTFADTRVAAPTNVNETSVQEEVNYAYNQNQWKHEPSAQVAILPAPGTTYASGFTGFCAYHSYTANRDVFLMVPYAGDEPFSGEDACASYYGKGDAAKATSLMVSHEYSEAATDPIWAAEPAWMDSEGSENGDICATPYDELPNGTFVQGTYDDHQNACSLADKAPPHVLALTERASHVTAHAAHLRGTVNPEGAETTYYFEYGPTTSYGTKVPAEAQGVGSGRANVSVEAVVGSLTRETVYHYRVAATNSSGTTYGEDVTFTPSQWQIQPTRVGPKVSPAAVGGISCVSAEWCMSVGYKYDLEYESSEPNRMLSYEWNGGENVERLVPEGEHRAFPGLADVSCVSRSFCMAVGGGLVPETGYNGAIIRRWNGKEWLVEEITLPGKALEAQFSDVSCPSTTECIAVGYIQSEPEKFENFAAIWKGSSWSAMSIPTQESTIWDDLMSISCVSSRYCVTSGYYDVNAGPSRPEILRWNGENWSFQNPVEATAALWSVSCASTTFCMAVNLFGGIEQWNGTAWTEVAPAKVSDVNGFGFEGVSCPSTTSCVLVGYGLSKINGTGVTLIEEWNGTKWQEQTTPRESERSNNGLNDVSCPGVESCAAAGASNASGAERPLIETREMPVTPTKSTTIGTSGSNPGQFSSPRGIAVGPNGEFWVVDSGNNRIEKFNSKGEYVSQFGSAGSGNGQFNTPSAIALDQSGDLWVTDAYNARVEEFNSKGEYMSKFGKEGEGPGEFIEPSGIAIDSSGNIWVTDFRDYRVEEFNSKGEYIRTSSVGFGTPTDLATDPEGHLWVTDSESNRVVELSSTGEYLSQFGTTGSADGQFIEPGAIAVTPSGELIVLDRWTGRAQEFSKSGEYLTQFGSGVFAEPGGVAATSGGVIYVSNTANNRVERWAEAPMAITNEPAAIGTTHATLAGTLNPGGRSTTYQFEYGTSVSYGSTAPASPVEAGSGTAEVQASTEIGGLQEQTTYHYRLVARNGNGVTYGKDRTFTTASGVPSQLKAMAVTDPFNGTSSTVSNFASNWSALGWAGGSTPKGADSSSGWGPSNTYATVNGAYYAPTVTDVGSGIADVATLGTNPSLEGRYFSLWLDMQTPGSTRAGYQLTFTDTASNTYEVKLSKWVGGTQTVLTTKSSYAFANGNSLALIDKGNTVSAWTNTGSGFTELLSATDSSFEGGNAGVEGSGNVTRLTNFKVGQLLASVTGTGAALEALALNDSFATSESPLSDGGAFAALAWDNSGSGHNTGQVSGGWGPYDAYSTINGAFWQKASFADTGAGDAVSAQLSNNPENTSRYFALWLNLPNPASAHSGYELRFKETSTNVYEVVLAKWAAGTETVLASKTGYSFAKGSLLALLDSNGTVSAWTKTGSEYTQLLSTSDSTYTSGYTGIEGSGSITRLKEFRGGPLPPH